MKAILPSAVRITSCNSYFPYEWGRTPRIPLREFYYPCCWPGGEEVDIASDFIGHRGPRYSEKPVYHKKPVGTTNLPYMLVNGHLVTPQLKAEGTYPCWYAVPGATLLHAWNGYGWPDLTRIYCTFTAYIMRYLNGHPAFYSISYNYRYSSREGIVLPNDQGHPHLMRMLGALFLSTVKGDLGMPLNKGKGVVAYARSWQSSFDPSDILQMFVTEHESNPLPLRTAYASVTRPQLYSPEPVSDLLSERDRMTGYPVMDITNYWFTYAKQHAFYEAATALPSLNDNSISNIMELGSFIKALVVDHKIEIPKRLSDAWLTYRYQYNTTKMDVREAIKFMNRHIPESMWRSGLTSYGAYTFQYKGVDITVRCTLKLRSKELDTVSRLWQSLSTYGLAPDFYAIWDMIPYSFVVDWFIPVGNVLSVLDAARLYNEEHYNFDSVIYSISYQIPSTDGVLWNVYSRWVESGPEQLSGMYWLEPDSPSKKVAGFRALDAVSLILG